jgi:ribose transport system substrate-binding protein
MNAPKPICIAGVVAMGWALAACGTPYHQPEERYVLVTANVNLPYWQEAQAGLTDIGKTAGVKVEMVGPATLSPSEELSEFQKVMAQNPAGIMV